MHFPGYDEFTVTPPVSHAIFTLREVIPADSKRLTIEFDEQGAALTMAYKPTGEVSDREVVLSDDTLAAAGMLLTCVSYQVITLSRMYAERGDEESEAARQRLRKSLSEVGLAMGLLEESLADTVTVTR